ncbi:alcohol acyltransferase 9-like [Magnolia sinica]|uniref:alcohol acyltransferase 9-like n=1 Tax=Magnolia sinica TaxID=86752 RepID=UPI002658CDA9|nr:alcohol acyltransferase 9-like [Magnolia sinica]
MHSICSELTEKRAGNARRDVIGTPESITLRSRRCCDIAERKEGNGLVRQCIKARTLSPEMITTLKNKAMIKCSTFEAIVAHLWKSRTRAVFEDPCGVSSVLFVVDIKSKITPPLPHGFVGIAVVTACASAKVVDLKESLGFCVEKVKEAIEMVIDKYVKSVVD